MQGRRMFGVGGCGAIVGCALYACVGEDPGVVQPPDSGTDATVGPDADPRDVVATDDGLAPSDAGLPKFDCPANAVLCETWEDDPVFQGWTPEIWDGSTLAPAPSTRFEGRALRATLAASPTEGRARAYQDLNAIAALPTIVVKLDYRVVARGPSPSGQTAPLQIAAGIVSATLPGGWVFELRQVGEKLEVTYDTTAVGGAKATLDVPAPNTQWHSVELTLARGASKSITLKVDGASTTAQNLGTFDGTALRLFGGLKSIPDTGETEVHLDNVVVLAQ